MILAVSSLPWRNTDWDLAGMIVTIAKQGYRGAEIYAATRQLPLLSPSDDGLARARAVAEGVGLRLSVHAPAIDLNPISLNPDVRNLTLHQYIATIRLARVLNAEFVTVHLGVMPFPGFSRDLAVESCVDFYGRVLDHLDSDRPALALENAAWRHRDPFPAVRDYMAVIASLGDPRVGLTLDVGHARLAGLDAATFIREAGHRLLNVHVHDNDGEEDWHWPIGEGVVNFRAVARALKEIRFAGFLTYECTNQDAAADAPRFAAQWEQFSMDTAGGR